MPIVALKRAIKAVAFMICRPASAEDMVPESEEMQLAIRTISMIWRASGAPG
jgi:hypothetical protein